MNIVGVAGPRALLQRINDLPSGTVYEANGAYWMITDQRNELDRILVVNVHDGRAIWQPTMATVVPSYMGFAPQPLK